MYLRTKEHHYILTCLINGLTEKLEGYIAQWFWYILIQIVYQLSTWVFNSFSQTRSEKNVQWAFRKAYGHLNLACVWRSLHQENITENMEVASANKCYYITSWCHGILSECALLKLNLSKNCFSHIRPDSSLFQRTVTYMSKLMMQLSNKYNIYNWNRYSVK